MAEAAAGDVVVADFRDEFGAQRLPLCRALGRPAAGSAGRIAGEAGYLCLLDIGTRWARLTRSRRMLDRVT